MSPEGEAPEMVGGLAPASGLREALRLHAAVFVPIVLLLPATFALPRLRLDGGLALAAYAVTESGGKLGLPLVALVALALLISRPGLSPRARAREAGVVLLSMGLVLGAAAWLNEHAIKPRFAVPRPDVRELAGAGVLGTTPEGFYAQGDKEARRAYLRDRLTPGAADALGLHPRIAAHWIQETGYSFPSGHSLGAMSFASAFFALGVAACAGWRRRAFAVLPPWALAVCFSRPLLRVHTPTDVSVGGLFGVLLGLLVFLLARLVLWRPSEGQPVAA